MPPDLIIRIVPVLRPLHWLALGWRDCFHSVAGILHGLVVAIAGGFIVMLGLRYPALLPGALSGFVLVAPLIATGLYEFSRRLEAGERPGLAQALGAWRREGKPLVQLGLLLLVLGTLWVGVSIALVGVYVPTENAGPETTLRALLAPSHPVLFLAWVVLGGSGAAVMFGLTAISMPMLLDRRVSLLEAMLTSVKAVGDNPAAMALWAAIIMTGTLIGMATGMLGLVLVVPVLGHASWHAYRDLVDASALPARL